VYGVLVIWATVVGVTVSWLEVAWVMKGLMGAGAVLKVPVPVIV